MDFVCPERRLIIESDGPHHLAPEQTVHDAERDAWLRSEGFVVLRLPDELVVGGTEIAVQRIRETLASVP